MRVLCMLEGTFFRPYTPLLSNRRVGAHVGHVGQSVSFHFKSSGCVFEHFIPSLDEKLYPKHK